MDDTSVDRALGLLAHVFVGSGSLLETLQWVAELSVAAMPGVELAGITLPEDGAARTSVFTDPASPAIDQAQYDAGTGPCLDALKTGIVQVLDDTLEDGPWVELRRAAADRGIRSTLSVPLAAGGRVVGVLNLYAPAPRSFGEAERAVAEQFAAQAAVVLANSRAYWGAHALSERLRAAMDARATIEQAKGILMVTQGCGADEAFDLLRRASQRENVKLRDIAARIVERAGNGSPPVAADE